MSLLLRMSLSNFRETIRIVIVVSEYRNQFNSAENCQTFSTDVEPLRALKSDGCLELFYLELVAKKGDGFQMSLRQSKH